MGARTLVRIYRDMVVIREFETMLDGVKKEGAYKGMEYDHRGPAHLSIGQEAAAVGQCFHLSAEDFHFRIPSEPRRNTGEEFFGD